jgi:nicotinate-nucleotide adenylyltransferase
MRTRIGIFGGTFNPVHCGHLKAAADAAAAFGLDKVLFVPSYIPPHKPTRDIAPAADRFRMVEIACRDFPRFAASPIEVEAAEKSYSIVTLEKVRAMYPGAWIFFILGVDAFLEIGTWHEYERVLDECLFIVIDRPGFALEAAAGVLGGRLAARTRRIEPGEELDDRRIAAATVFLLAIGALDISSTDIRNRIRNGRTLEGLVPPPVAAYIREYQLYVN